MDVTVENKALPVLRKAIRQVLRPLVKTMLQHGLPFKVFMEEAKRMYVEVAGAEFSLAGRKQSAARVAIITGLSRKEISRIHNTPSPDSSDNSHPVNRAARVISAWAGDPEFQDDNQQPLSLPFDGDSPSFTELVRKSSGDMLVRAMLDELVRVDAVEVTDHKIRLINKSYIPVKSELEKLRILGTDTALLVETIHHNLQKDVDEPFFQRKVYYDNLPEDALCEIRFLARKHGQEIIELLDKRIQKHDRDVNPDVRGEGRYTAGVGVYYFEHSS